MKKNLVIGNFQEEASSTIFYDKQEVLVLEKGTNISIVENLKGKRFEAANSHLRSKQVKGKLFTYYLLNGVPVTIAERAGKFMVTVKSDRLHGERKVFVSDLENDLTKMH